MAEKNPSAVIIEKGELEEHKEECLSQINVSGSSSSDPELINSTEFDSEDHNHAFLPDQDAFFDKLATKRPGAEFSDPMGKLINHHARDFGQPEDKAVSSKDTSQPALVASNLCQLCLCQANVDVLTAMTPSAKIINEDLHLVEAAICNSLSSQALAFDKLMALKEMVPISCRDKFNDIFDLMENSVELSSFGRARVNESRRNQIHLSIKDNYPQLAHETRPENGLLFGNNLEHAMKSVKSPKGPGKKLSGSANESSRFFLGQSQKGSEQSCKGYHPYHQSQRYQAPHRNQFQQYHTQTAQLDASQSLHQARNHKG